MGSVCFQEAGMISVLCPSRGRVPMLRRSIEGLRLLATSDIEVLIAADPDDKDTYRWAEDHADGLWMPEVRMFYNNFHLYVNALASEATGSMYLLWNDDATMSTRGWDARILVCGENVVQTIGTLFPAVPARWVDHLGHFARERHCDSWWDEISKMLGRRGNANVQGKHENPGDQTSLDTRGKKRTDFYGEENMSLIRQDAAKLREIL